MQHYHKKSLFFVRLEVFTAMAMKNGVFRDVIPCGSCKNQHFGGMNRLYHQGDKNRPSMNVSSNSLRSVLWLLVTANVVPSSPILITLMMLATRSFETLVFARATWRNSPEDGTLPYFFF
jgi:hypothetical protein